MRSLTLNEHMEQGERPLASRMLDLLKRREQQLEVAVAALRSIATPGGEPCGEGMAREALEQIQNISSNNE